MFIPAVDYKKGQSVRLTCDIRRPEGTYTKGHIFQIDSRVHDTDAYLLTDAEGHTPIISEQFFCHL